MNFKHKENIIISKDRNNHIFNICQLKLLFKLSAFNFFKTYLQKIAVFLFFKGATLQNVVIGNNFVELCEEDRTTVENTHEKTNKYISFIILRWT